MKLREKQAQMTRELIKSSALELFCSQGIEQTDMSQIALKAEISRRTLYHHFNDKESLAGEIYAENLQAMFGQLLIDFNLEQPEQSLETILNKYLKLKEQFPAFLYYDAIFHVYYSTMSKNPADLPKIQQLLADSHTQFQQSASLTITPEEREKWTHIFLMSTHLYFTYLQKAVVISYQRGGIVTEEDNQADRKFKDFIMSGIRSH